ncbi:aryl-alcohol dehydrogenase-like predicted oxidoreductase [Rhizobium petrolearium]|uniref:aldo/keto reductase n=1 Tax=Neorhizobium petrolearium TaxID=515361 RepID=UPI001AE954DF|nr:aldo/keto reductase [Neorhizobium petrolearium]MBP1842534.1 aryl-alcohol dehydrogenase-like predicted oxidoreductase [Neorhizobium petrolearium]
MKQVVIPGINLRCSRFILGTASLFNAGRPDTRYRLLKAAVDAGFTHFDTAPYYGFGAAERDLKQVLREHPALTVTTKVGIYSPGGEAQPDALIFLRKAAGRVIKPISAPTKTFDLARAKVALERSLRRLGRDRIDVYTLHEPDPGTVRTDEWLRWREDCVKAGKVKNFGLASTADRVAPIAEHCVALCQYVQVLDSLENREADALSRYGLPMQVTYGYVSGARSSGNHASVENILMDALRRNRSGAVIVSTLRPERLPQYARIAESAA